MELDSSAGAWSNTPEKAVASRNHGCSLYQGKQPCDSRVNWWRAKTLRPRERHSRRRKLSGRLQVEGDKTRFYRRPRARGFS